MKPVKNKVFCIDCGRSKQLFESESKADNFIRFNGEEILEESDKAPIRSYYCPSCGGWHVTSSPIARNVKTRSERFIEKRKADAEARREVHKVYDEKIKDAKHKIKDVVNSLPEAYEKLKEECLLANTREDKFALLTAFKEKLNHIRVTMALTKGQRKLIRNLEESIKSFYYEIKNAPD